MDWQNERYVRLFTRDTTTWRRLEWDGQCLLMQLLRKVDRSGVLDIQDMAPVEAARLHTGAPADIAERGMTRLLDLGVIVHTECRLAFPKFLDAQECAMSDKLRAKLSRERRASQNVTSESQNVTECHAESHAVTPSHAASHAVTPRHSSSDPIQPDPTRAEPETARTDIARTVRTDFVNRYMALRASVPTEAALAKTMPSIVSWIRQSAPLRGVSEQTLWVSLADAFFAADESATKGWHPAWLAHDPSQWLQPVAHRKAGAPPVDMGKRRALEAQRAERKAVREKLAKCSDDSERYSLEIRIGELDMTIPRLEAACS